MKAPNPVSRIKETFGWLAKASLLALSLSLLPAAAAAQAFTVSGRVVSARTLEPLVGATVILDGTTTGTTTNGTGSFTFRVPSPTATLNFSMLGFQSQSVAIAGRPLINITMQEAAVALQEIVAVGYGQQTRATVSGSVSSVNAVELERTAALTTSGALVGRMQGISTRTTTQNGGRSGDGLPTDGRPGAAPVLQIRNMGNPLFVIDGIPTTDANDFNRLNAADIEQVSVLKDAAASVYGFRAANGVILVTTKKGDRERPPQVRIDGNYGWQNFTRYQYKDMTNAYEYMWSKVDGDQNRGVARSVDPQVLENWRTGAPGFESTNHYPLVINNPNAPQYSLNANVSGGSNNSQYYLSVGSVGAQYVMRDNAFSRTNAQINLSSSLTERFKVGTEISARQDYQNNIAVLGDSDPIRSMLLGIHSSWPMENPWLDAEHTMIDRTVRRIDRTVAMYDQDIAGYMHDTRRNLQGNFWAEYELPFGPIVRATYSHNVATRTYDKQQFDFTAWRCTNEDDLSTCVEELTPAARLRDQTKREEVNHFGSVEARHSANVGSHSLDGTLALELNGSQNWQTSIGVIPPNNFSHIIRDTDPPVSLNNSWGISRRASVASRIGYDYADKYLLTLLGRYDGSYLYAPDNRWGFFPGITAGWRLTEEPFLRDRFGFLDDLKLRASWGQTGREQGLNAWDYLGGATYAQRDWVFNGTVVTGAAPRGLPVTNLSWVTSTTKNVGFDGVFFNNKISAEIDLFERSLTGLPAGRDDVLLPQEVGYGLPNENLESQATRGFEFLIRYNERVGPVDFSIAPNFTVARTKWVERYRQRFSSDWSRYNNGGAEGRWLGAAFGRQVIGQFQSLEEIAAYDVNIDGQGNRTLLPGDLIYKDVNGDKIINGSDNRVIGYAEDQTPIISFGMQNSLSLGNLALNLTWAGGAGYSHNRANEMQQMFPSDHNSQAWVMDRWHREDPYNAQSKWIPGRYPPYRQGSTTSSWTGGNNTYWRTNVRYVRLNNVELGYSIPDALSRNLSLSGVRVYTSATNPYTLDNVSHYVHDPEIRQTSGLNYPTTQVVTVGFTARLGGQQIPAPVVPVPAD